MTIRVTAPGGKAPDNVVYASDYSTLAAAVAASCDASKTLLLNKSFNVSSPVAITTNGSTIIGIGRGYNGTAPCKLTATGTMSSGLLDVRANGVTLEGFCLDMNSQTGNGISIGHIPSTSTGTAFCGALRDVEIMNASDGCALQLGDDWDYWDVNKVRMMTGNKRCININNPAGTAYDNGHLYISKCEMSAGYESFRRNPNSAISENIQFWGCDFHDGHNADYMVDGTDTPHLKFYGCSFEANDGANQGPLTAMVYINSYGAEFHQCIFGFKDNTDNTYYGILGNTSYGIGFVNNIMENSVAAHTEVRGSFASVTFHGLNSTQRYSCAGTASSNAVDIWDLVD